MGPLIILSLHINCSVLLLIGLFVDFLLSVSLKAILSSLSLIRAEINFVHLPPSVSVWRDEDDNKSDKFPLCLWMWNCLQKSVKPILLLKSAVTTILLLIRSLGHQHWDLLSCLDYSVDDFCFQGLSRDFKNTCFIKMRQSLSDSWNRASMTWFFFPWNKTLSLSQFSKHIFLKGIKHREYKRRFIAYDSVPGFKRRLTLAKGLQREQSFL